MISVVRPSLKILPFFSSRRTAPVQTSYWEVTHGLIVLSRDLGGSTGPGVWTFSGFEGRSGSEQEDEVQGFLQAGALGVSGGSTEGHEPVHWQRSGAGAVQEVESPQAMGSGTVQEVEVAEAGAIAVLVMLAVAGMIAAGKAEVKPMMASATTEVEICISRAGKVTKIELSRLRSWRKVRIGEGWLSL